MEKDKLSVYLSEPSVKLAHNEMSNDEIMQLVSSNFSGNKKDWQKIEIGISYIFKQCDSSIRYLGLKDGKSAVDYAVDVSNEVCLQNGVEVNEIDLLIYGGIYRDYFEPATAMEISSKLGLNTVSAFDVTNACAGLMQSTQVADAMMRTNPNIKYALCCTTDFPDEAIDFNIQSFSELAYKSAGLTLGGGASAWLLSREPFAEGCVELLKFQNTSIPDAYSVCKVPIFGKKFDSLSSEIFNLGLLNVPNEIEKIIKEQNWSVDEVDYFITHQPSRKIIQDICSVLGVSLDKAPIIHHLYGNTINSSIPMTMNHLINRVDLIQGTKLIFNSSAAGFSMVTAAGIWTK